MDGGQLEQRMGKLRLVLFLEVVVVIAAVTVQNSMLLCRMHACMHANIYIHVCMHRYIQQNKQTSSLSRRLHTQIAACTYFDMGAYMVR
jgi:hypothetical protein